MNRSAHSLHSTRLTRQTHSAWHRDDCHQPLMQCLSLRCVCLSHNLKERKKKKPKKKQGFLEKVGWAGGGNFGARHCGCRKWVRCPIFSVRVADRVHINTCETGKPQLWQSLLAQACVIHFMWHWHRGIWTSLPHCCIAGRGYVRDNTPRVELCSVILAQRGL